MENIVPIHELPKSPKRQLISEEPPPFPRLNNKLSHSIIDTTSTDQTKRPLLVSKRTSTTHPIVPVLLTQVTSTGQLADQYWSYLPLNRSEAPSSNSRLSPTVYIRHALHWIGRSQRGAYIVRKGRKRGRSLLKGELKSSLRQPRRRREAPGQASLRPAHAGAPAARAHASRER